MKKNSTTILLITLLTLINTISEAQTFKWRLMNSDITTFAKHPTDSNVIFAGDAAGLIRVSLDRGATWKVASMKSESKIVDIKFINSNHGYAISSGSLVLETTDGGKTWNRKALIGGVENGYVSSYNYKKIIQLNDSVVFFEFFNHPISAPSTNEVVVTRDGGKTFKREVCPGNICKVSGDTLLAFGRQISNYVNKFCVYKSVDKGLSWQLVKLAPTGLVGDFNNNGINLSFALSSKEFFINANRDLVSDRNIYKTTDGGLTFKSIVSPDTKKVDWMYFKNSMEGFSVSYMGEFSYTSDGGATWTTVPKSSNFPAYYLGGNSFIGNKMGRTTISTDMGKTWTDQSDPIYNISSTSASVEFLRLINDTIAFASIGRNFNGTSQGYELVRTIDGGLSWKWLKDSASSVFKGTLYHFVSADTFFTVGSGYGGYMKIRYTTNAGKNFRDVFSGSYFEQVKDIVFIDKKHGVTYNPYGTINFSSDSGKTWKAVSSSSTMGEIATMAFPAPDAWFAISTTTKKIYKSSDTAKTWVDITPLSMCGGSLYFTNKNVGFIHGCRGQIFMTNDGGASWTDIKNFDSNFIYRMTPYMGFLNDSLGYISDPSSGSAYQYAKTTDGGKTWKSTFDVQVYSTMNIQVKSEKLAAMLGQSGGLVRYYDDLVFTTDTIIAPKVVAGISDMGSLNGSVSVYPNPATDMLNIESPDAKANAIIISDVLGREIYAEKLSGAYHAKVFVGGILPGIYFVQISTSKGIATSRILIK